MNSPSIKALRRAVERESRPEDRSEERRLLAAARGGDRGALNEVARRVSGSLYRFGRGFCRDPHDAEDVMQDVLAALVTSLKSFRGDATLSTWAYVVARNACLKRRRHRDRWVPLEPAAAGGEAPLMTPFEPADPAGGPERAAERRELREALERAIAALPDAQREVLVLRDVEGLSGERVAQLLGLELRAMKSRLHRARLAVRAALAPHVAPGAPGPGPSCPDTARLLSRHLEGELDGAVCERLAAHVEACPSCGAACDSLRAALGACRAWRRAPVPDQVRAEVRAAIRSAVAGLRATGVSVPVPAPAPARAPRRKRP